MSDSLTFRFFNCSNFGFVDFSIVWIFLVLRLSAFSIELFNSIICHVSRIPRSYRWRVNFAGFFLPPGPLSLVIKPSLNTMVFSFSISRNEIFQFRRLQRASILFDSVRAVFQNAKLSRQKSYNQRTLSGSIGLP